MEYELIRSPIRIPYKDKEIDAIVTRLRGGESCKCGIILTHGAGGDMNTQQLVQVCDKMAEAGFLAVRFTCRGLNIKYRIAVFTEVLKSLRSTYNIQNFFVGGRSMGARAAVGMVTGCLSQHMMDDISGVVCLSYPLHSTDNIHDLRDNPLYEITKPVLFVSGSDDSMCHKDTMTSVIGKMEKSQVPVDIQWIDGADHSLKVKKQCEGVENVSSRVCTWCCKILNTKSLTVDCKQGSVSMETYTEQMDKKKDELKRKHHQSDCGSHVKSKKMKTKTKNKTSKHLSRSTK